MAKLTESYLRNMIKQVMKEASFTSFDQNEDDRKFQAKLDAKRAKEQARFDNFKGGSAFDDEYFEEGAPWEEALMNLETMVTEYEYGGMASPDDLVQAADEMEALLPSVPRSKKQDVRKMIAAAHEQLGEYQPMPNYSPGGMGANDPHLSPTMDESRKPKLAPKRKVLKEEFSQQENQILTQARNLGKPDFANAVADYLRSKDHVKSGQLSAKMFNATVGKKDLYDVYKKALETKGQTPRNYHASNLDFAPQHPYDTAESGYEGRHKY